MTIFIPMWVIWTAGIAVAAVVVGVVGFFAISGYMLSKMWR